MKLHAKQQRFCSRKGYKKRVSEILAAHIEKYAVKMEQRNARRAAKKARIEAARERSFFW